nr:hypothetical protein [Nanoarchaeum sp.]
MDTSELLATCVSAYLEDYIDLKLVEHNLRHVSNSERQNLEKFVNDQKRIESLLSVLTRRGIGFVDLNYNPETSLFSIGTDMDYTTSRQIVRENNLKYIALQPIITETSYFTYIVFEAPHYPEAVALIDAYIKHFEKK